MRPPLFTSATSLNLTAAVENGLSAPTTVASFSMTGGLGEGCRDSGQQRKRNKVADCAKHCQGLLLFLVVLLKRDSTIALFERTRLRQATVEPRGDSSPLASSKVFLVWAAWMIDEVSQS